jgi:hypothetical protein
MVQQRGMGHRWCLGRGVLLPEMGARRGRGGDREQDCCEEWALRFSLDICAWMVVNGTLELRGGICIGYKFGFCPHIQEPQKRGE